MTKTESNVIKLIRFPLAFLVVLWHTPHEKALKPIIDLDFGSIDYICDFLIVLGEHIVQISVPCFFVISGYLFFQGLNNTSCDSSFFVNKFKKRIKSLLIPYLCWNTFAILYFVIVKVVACLFLGKDWNSIIDFLQETIPGGYWVADSHQTYFTNLLGVVYMEYTPIVVPLWFIRDLFVMVLFSPLFYYLIKKAGEIFLILIVFLYFTNIWLEIPGFEIRAITFFYIGAYLSIKSKGLFAFSKPILSALFLIISVFFSGKEMHIGIGSCQFMVSSMESRWYLSHLFIFFGTFSVFHIFWYFAKKELFVPQICVDSTFFIYALHTIAIIYLIHDSMFYIFGNSSLGNLLCYILTPSITVMFIMLVYSLCIRNLPSFTRVLSGGR